ncbi:MAG: hypothetical protein IK095_01665 [Oscillospiraceae bacterium]|nr:hypothetical protein [Oscillospiraceae bacterium]
MSIESSLQSLKQTVKETAMIAHRNDTDEQLREVVVRNSRLIATISNTQQGIIEGYKLMGEMEGCSALLDQRRQKRAALSQKKNSWHKERAAREDAVLLALESAVSPNGQLLAAILEDEGDLPRERLRVWCDELAALDDESFDKLLTGLVQEGIVREEDGAYSLICPLTEDMTWTPDAIEREIRKTWSGNEEEAANARLIVHLMQREGEPLSKADVIRLIEEERETLALDPRFAPALGMSEFDAGWNIGQLEKAGAFSKEYRHDGTDYYWYALVGERRS